MIFELQQNKFSSCFVTYASPLEQTVDVFCICCKSIFLSFICVFYTPYNFIVTATMLSGVHDLWTVEPDG